MDSSFSSDLRRYLSLLFHWAWLLALATGLAAATAFLVSQRLTPVYQAATTVLINEAPANKTTDYASLVTSERLATTYAEIMTKMPVLQAVIDRLALNLTPAELERAISVQPVRDTQLIEVKVQDPNPFRAAQIANTLVAVFSEQNRSLQASRYANSKASLEAQLDQLENQIDENNQALETLGGSGENAPERDRLKAAQEQYRRTYASLLALLEETRLKEAQPEQALVQVEPAAPPEIGLPAVTTLLVRRPGDSATMTSAENLPETTALLLLTEPVLSGIIQYLQLDLSVLNVPLTVEDLSRSINASRIPEADLIRVEVRHPNPIIAAAIANALPSVYNDQDRKRQLDYYDETRRSLQTQLDEVASLIDENAAALAALGEDAAGDADRGRLEAAIAQYRQMYANVLGSYEQVRLAETQSTSNVTQVEPATPPRFPISPRILTNTLLAGVVGLMLASGLVFLVEAMDDTLRSPDQVTGELGLPVLGLIVHNAGLTSRPLTLEVPRSPLAEAFRHLRTNIQYSSVDHPLHSLLVTSPEPSDGKSTVAANLAVVLAQSGRRVLLMDADLRHPQVHRLFELPNRHGTSNLFVQPEPTLDGALQPAAIPGLFALTAGPLPPNPSELLGSDKMSVLLEQAGQQADIVLVDSPPVMAVTDSSVLAPRVDGVLLVLRPGMTKLAAARQAVEQLRRVGANLLGVVLNEVDVKSARYRFYHYDGYYYDFKEYTSPVRKVKNPPIPANSR